MSAVIRRIPRDQRLRITATFQHETLKFEGDVFKFIQHLMDNKLTGKGTFTVNQGGFCGLEFDVRSLVVQDAELSLVKNTLDTQADTT